MNEIVKINEVFHCVIPLYYIRGVYERIIFHRHVSAFFPKRFCANYFFRAYCA